MEEAKVDILEERPFEAMQHLAGARHRDWFAARLYLRACDHAGLLELCVLDPAEVDSWGTLVAWHHAERDPDAVWRAGDCEFRPIAEAWVRFHRGDLQGELPPLTHPQAWRVTLRVHRKREDDARLAEAALSFIQAHPEQPQVLSELFIGRFDGPKTARARKRVLRQVKRRRPQSDAERFRRLRFWMSAGESEQAEREAEGLVEAGFPRPATRKPYNDTMERALGGVLARQLSPTVDAPTASDRLALASVVTARWRDEERWEASDAVWSEVRSMGDSSSAASQHARVLKRLGADERATEVVTEAMRLASLGVPDDVARQNRTRWRLELRESLLAAAEVRGDPAYEALAHRLFPDEGSPVWAPSAVSGPARIAADVLQLDDAESWQALSDLLEKEGQHLFSDLAAEHAADRNGAPTPRSTAMRAAWSDSSTAPVAVQSLQIGDAFPLESIGLVLGRKHVIAAWASWCGPCKQELPALDTVLKEAGAVGVALSVDQQPVGYRKALAQFRFTAMTPTRDPALGLQLGVGALPTVLLVNELGVLVDRQIGYSPENLDRIRAWVGE